MIDVQDLLLTTFPGCSLDGKKDIIISLLCKLDPMRNS